ncbi:Uncharacterised protein [[Clostridium] sordellii]|uniref:hypothetical protein n=1 Tax=Paraclostridium sordellii TaxID=1505 RepID=UPI0005DD44C8|nr:hypothetical protein [Paeniclostridium sordellii]CEN25426.1 Uncharacterised protein [[Clostridium] sordellii] [Paeniclostridium sordellii]
MPNEKVKRLMDFRKRTYALLSMQASLEGATIIDIVEKAIEDYANPTIKEIINSQYGEWEERSKTKKSGRPRTKNKEPLKEPQSEETLNTDNKKDTFIYIEAKDEKNKENMLHIKEDNKHETSNIETSNIEEELTDEEKKLLECYS